MYFLSLVLLVANTACAEDVPLTKPAVRFHLTARLWQPLDISRNDYLDTVQGLCRFTAQHQDERGAIIDPVIDREHQYATLYFAYAVGVLVDAGKTSELLPHGIHAMEYATAGFSQGTAGIPDGHGEFFLAPLAGTLAHYEPHVDAATIRRSTERLGMPHAEVLQDGGARNNNWRTYAMRGEWTRARAGLVPMEDTIAFIDDAQAAWEILSSHLRRCQEVRKPFSGQNFARIGSQPGEARSLTQGLFLQQRGRGRQDEWQAAWQRFEVKRAV